MAICKKLFFFLFLFSIFILTHSYAYSSSLEENFKEKKISYLEFILNNLENKTLIRSKKLVYSQPVAIRIQYQSIGSLVKFNKDKNKIIIDIVGVMDQRRYKKKNYKPKLSDCNIIRNLIFFNQHGYGFFQKRNKYLTTDDMEQYFINNFLNNMYLNEKEVQELINNINVNVEIISPNKNHNFFCSGNIVQDELE